MFSLLHPTIRTFADFDCCNKFGSTKVVLLPTLACKLTLDFDTNIYKQQFAPHPRTFALLDQHIPSPIPHISLY